MKWNSLVAKIPVMRFVSVTVLDSAVLCKSQPKICEYEFDGIVGDKLKISWNTNGCVMFAAPGPICGLVGDPWGK